MNNSSTVQAERAKWDNPAGLVRIAMIDEFNHASGYGAVEGNYIIMRNNMLEREQKYTCKSVDGVLVWVCEEIPFEK
jgi:hypothetical protein